MRISTRQTSSSPHQVWLSPGLHNLLTTRRGRLGLLLTAAFIIGAVALGGRIYGQHLANQDLIDRDRARRQLETVSQNLERQSAQQAGDVAALQVKLAQLQEKLDRIMPANDTYRMNPNESVVVGNGRLTLGLVGVPTADGVTLNVNGKQHTVAAGGVILVADDASAPCKVAVQSSTCSTPRSPLRAAKPTRC